MKREASTLTILSSFFSIMFSHHIAYESEAAFPSLKFYKFKRFYGHYEILFKTKIITDLKIEAYCFTMTSTNLMYNFLSPFYRRFNNEYAAFRIIQGTLLGDSR